MRTFAFFFRLIGAKASPAVLLAAMACAPAAAGNNSAPESQRRADALSPAEIKRHQQGEMNDNLASITILALEYIHGSRHVESNLPKAIARFEQVVAKRYGPAEYGFGWLLLTGENRYRPGTATSEAQLRRNPQRGVELLKRSAASSCSYRDPYREQNMPQVAFELSELYRGHSGVPADAQESGLWLARSILHCGFDDAGYIRARFLGEGRGSMKKAEALTWLLLMNAREEGRKLAAGMPAGKIKSATKKAEKLRKAVSESEGQYPAPRSAARH